MKKVIQHPNEVALEVVTTGIKSGYLTEDILAEVCEYMEWDVPAGAAFIRDLLQRKVIFKELRRDDFSGKFHFYSFTKPEKPTVKRIGTMLIPASHMTGQAVRSATGIKLFAKHKDIIPAPPKVYGQRTLTANSIVASKTTLKKVFIKPVRTKWPVKKEDTQVITFNRPKRTK